MDLRATRAEISKAALKNNLAYFRKLIPSRTQLCMAVKANAYGHGLKSVAQIASPLVDAFAVATVSEAIELREAGCKQEILLLSAHTPEEIPSICQFQISPFVSHEHFIQLYQEEASRIGCQLKLHLKIDTGMGRAGVLPEEAPQIAQHIYSSANLVLQGLCTHFAVADETGEESKAYTLGQLAIFEKVRQKLEAQGTAAKLLHAANSAATVQYPETHYDMVRVGIGAYGYYGQTQPVMELKTRISIVKQLPKGHKVSYGCTWQAPRATQIGILPVGYADGYSRLLSNCGQVLIDGEIYPVIGRVCMDQFAIQIDGLENPLGKEVLLFGRHPELNAHSLAAQCRSISYEILTSVATRVPRHYI